MVGQSEEEAVTSAYLTAFSQAEARGGGPRRIHLAEPQMIEMVGEYPAGTALCGQKTWGPSSGAADCKTCLRVAAVTTPSSPEGG